MNARGITAGCAPGSGRIPGSGADGNSYAGRSSRPWPALWACVVACLSGCLGGARAAETELSPANVATLRSVTEAAIAPDGGKIAYLTSKPRKPGVDEDGEAWSELWIWDARTGRSRPFVGGKVTVEKPGWTPDGAHVVFLAKRGDDKTKSVYWIPVDGGEARVAAALESDIGNYSLSGDGSRMAVLATEPENAAAKKLKDQGFKQEIFEEDSRRTRVWVVKPFETDAKAAVPLAVTGSVRQVRWHPTSDRLALSVTPTPSVDDGLMRQRIVIVDVATGSEVASVDHAGKLERMEWSPDGAHLAFVGGEDIHDPSAGRLWVVTADGGKPRDLMPGLAADAAGFAWRDKERLWVLLAEGVRTSVREVGLAGSPAPAWIALAGGPIGTSIAVAPRSGDMVLVGSTPFHPAELFARAADGTWQRRTDSNPWLAGVRWAKQETVRHRAKDGLELEGILIRPLQEEPGKRVPLILSV
ncbi:MAG: hypothetical protein JNL97_00995, partial [Verrucomicrobiales bacterium]|nr:hypothetical protein [Verrucomicrobiales bacterium]